MKKIHTVALSLAAALAVAGCASLPPTAELDKMADQMIKASFQTRGIAKVERITGIDDTLKACNAADVAGKPLDKKAAEAIDSGTGYGGSLSDLNASFCTGNNATALVSKWLRGFQVSDASGRVTIDGIFPGWYASRTTHVHFIVTANGHSSVTSQLFFDEALTTAVYTKHGSYSSRGNKDTTNARDNVASGLTLSSVLMTVSQQSDGALVASRPTPFTSMALDWTRAYGGSTERDGEVVAFALFFTNFSTFLARPGIYLEDLYVRPSHRGRGIGSRSSQVIPHRLHDGHHRHIVGLHIDKGSGHIQGRAFARCALATAGHAQLFGERTVLLDLVQVVLESAEALIDRQQILVLENLCRRPSASGDACIKGRDGWHAGNASTGPYTAPQPARMDP